MFFLDAMTMAAPRPTSRSFVLGFACGHSILTRSSELRTWRFCQEENKMVSRHAIDFDGLQLIVFAAAQNSRPNPELHKPHVKL
ncbi:hypothetical protein [Acrocarpospora macrocephala]|uniref:hypothetical protein n=1 Tax=Acrocarpospora macrocephala TaxID=150177 RepID=UPI0012D347F9|nr:hypothetical protein [Acrocarpospora macrocephala]